MQQAIDFREESDALFALLDPLSDADFEHPTLFKNWTINAVVRHLHMWNWAADTSLQKPDDFQDFIKHALGALSKPGGLRQFEEKWLDGKQGKPLLREWHEFYPPMSERFTQADPRRRVKWGGPDMSVRSSITARLMETWAHGLAIYDLLGVERVDADRIRGIAQLGINTFGWTYRNRGSDVPAEVPHIRLTAPSGALWVWNESVANNLVEGSATEFCQVVTQTRNIADTSLRVEGEIASDWMSVAQCFAGPMETPPAPGGRVRNAAFVQS